MIRRQDRRPPLGGGSLRSGFGPGLLRRVRRRRSTRTLGRLTAFRSMAVLMGTAGSQAGQASGAGCRPSEACLGGKDPAALSEMRWKRRDRPLDSELPEGRKCGAWKRGHSWAMPYISSRIHVQITSRQGDLPLYSELNSGSPIPIFWLVVSESARVSAYTILYSLDFGREPAAATATDKSPSAPVALSHPGARACKLDVRVLHTHSIPRLSEPATFTNRLLSLHHGGAALETRTARRTIAPPSEDVQRCACRSLLYLEAPTLILGERRSSPGILGSRRSGCAHRVESAFAHFRWCV